MCVCVVCVCVCVGVCVGVGEGGVCVWVLFVGLRRVIVFVFVCAFVLSGVSDCFVYVSSVYVSHC